MKNLDFDWLTDEFMLYCRSTQLREKTMSSYEQSLHLFGRWCADELKIYTVDKITENVIRKYIDDLQNRGKYTFYVNDLSKKKNYPDRRRDYRKTKRGGAGIFRIFPFCTPDDCTECFQRTRTVPGIARVPPRDSTDGE